MFISTVIHLAELLLLSLLGIMIYKLFSAYRKWKALSVTSSRRGGDRPSSASMPVQSHSSDYLSVSKITVTEEQSSDKFSALKDSSGILTDYIGEFFTESKQVDLEPFRQQPVDVALSQAKVSPSANLSNYDVLQIAELEPDTFITVASELAQTQHNKVMSDKVVLAMLDEARLVRAS